MARVIHLKLDVSSHCIYRIFAFRRASLLEEHHITHVLSVIRYSLDPARGFDSDKYEHLSIDIDDVDEADILVHLPRMVRFIHQGLYGVPDEPVSGNARTGPESPDAITAAPSAAQSLDREFLQATRDSRGPKPTGSVLVHCAMGKSRSVAAVVAYLLWKYPHRFGAAEARDPDGPGAARTAVARALNWVRQTRGMAEPNDGFVRQLEMWWEMGCPAGSDDAVARDRVYRRWAYGREVEEAGKLGMAPERLMFQDEEEGRSGADGRVRALPSGAGLELRCKKCRRVLVTKPYLVPHESNGRPPANCSYFVEPLSWMRPTLEEGLLEGRITCPGAKCGASIGRYSWQGFKCACGEWVCPAFSLHKSKVDEVATAPPRGPAGRAVAGAEAERMAALGIRLPPGLASGKGNL